MVKVEFRAGGPQLATGGWHRPCLQNGQPHCHGDAVMSASLILNRRNFLRTSLAGASAAAFGVGPAEAQGRSETLLVVQELGPNSLDMQGVGSNQTVNGLSWNCYDRLLTYAAKTLPDGTLSYDREKLAPELAESWEVAADGMSCTFKLRKGATFHDGSAGHGKGRQMVVRQGRQGRRLPDIPDVGRLAGKARTVRGRRRSHLPHRLRPQGQDAAVQRRRRRAVHHQFGTREEERDTGRPLGDGLAEEQRGRRRRLPDRKLEARHRNDLRPLRQLEERAAAEDQAHHRARHPVGRNASCDAGAGRCRSLERFRAARLRSDHEGRQDQGVGRADPERVLVSRAEHRQAAVR